MKFYTSVFPQYPDYLMKELQDCETVLDLGCGPASNVGLSSIRSSIGVELFRPYLIESKKKKIHTQYIWADIRNVEFVDSSFDAVIFSDVIEHISRKEGNIMIKKMEKWAKKKVIIFTTNGFVDQSEYDNNSLQVHKSGWVVEDFRVRGFRVHGVNGVRIMRTEKEEIKFKPKFVWQFFSDLTQRITYNHPRGAFQLLCTKNVTKNK